MVWYILDVFIPDQSTMLFVGNDLYGQPILGDFVIDLPDVYIFRAERLYRYSGTLYTKLNSLITTSWSDFIYRAFSYTGHGLQYTRTTITYIKGKFRFKDDGIVSLIEFENYYFINS